ncbi:hypothetical protein QR680_016059 [Steinernema hermaphroditum]|uniref:Metalloendopeptidase n=1 Tax=Steinernema hermaphroditum TaxID=289476 RepID=A0AA39LLN8_9BILA|nr:hypothetical protein QR680_016059 [Steinernema hermaphroditum]
MWILALFFIVSTATLPLSTGADDVLQNKVNLIVSSLPKGPNGKPLKGKDLLKKTIANYTDFDELARLIADQKRRAERRFREQEDVLYNKSKALINKVIAEAKLLNPKPPPAEAPLNFAEINSAAGLDEVLVEGDMLMTLEQAKKYFGMENDSMTNGVRSKRQALRDLSTRWPKGIVYYGFDDAFADTGKEAVRAAIGFWERNTCIRFKYLENPGTIPPGSEGNVIFYEGNGCFSELGKSEWLIQHISLAPWCQSVRVATHEIAHTLGLFHEQSRYDRDTYIYVDTTNIQEDYKGQYGAASATDMNNYGKPYDYRGIMHYWANLWAKDTSKPIMYALNPAYQMSIGYAQIPTYGDSFILNMHYECYDKCANSETSITVNNVIGNGQKEPANLTDPAKCTWHVTAPTGSKIQYMVTYIGTDGNENALCHHECFYGGVSIKGLEQTWIPEGMRFCCPAQFNKLMTTFANQLVVQPWNALRFTDFSVKYRLVPTGRRSCPFDYQFLSVDGTLCYHAVAQPLSYTVAIRLCRNNGGTISMAQDPVDAAILKDKFLQKIQCADPRKTITRYWNEFSNGKCGIFDINTSTSSYEECLTSTSKAGFVCAAPSN